MPNILITGANGFLGSEIVRHMAATSFRICATDKQGASIFPNIDYRPADILIPASLSPVFQGADCVIHVAGLAHIFNKTMAHNASFKDVNQNGTKNVAHTAANSGVNHFILISSVSVYGSFIREECSESMPCLPEGEYGKSKFGAEQCAIASAKESGMALTILRLATLYGEGDPGNVARLMKAIDRGRFIWVGNGFNRKSLLYKSDAAQAVMAVVRAPASGINIFNISAPPYTMRDVVDGLSMALKRRVPSWHIPESLALYAAESVSTLAFKRSRLGNMPSTIRKWLANDVYDASKFRGTFNFNTQTKLAEGLQKEVDWYRAK